MNLVITYKNTIIYYLATLVRLQIKFPPLFAYFTVFKNGSQVYFFNHKLKRILCPASETIFCLHNWQKNQIILVH